MNFMRPWTRFTRGVKHRIQQTVDPTGLLGVHLPPSEFEMLEDLHDAWARWGWQEGLNDANCTTGWNLWAARGNAGLQTVNAALTIYGAGAAGARALGLATETRALSVAATSEAGAITESGGGAASTRVWTTTTRPVDLARAGTGEIHPATGKLTSPGAGGTFVTRMDITDPAALELHIRGNVPTIQGQVPKYLTEIEVPEVGLEIDPTEVTPRPHNAWVGPNTPGATIVRQWRVRPVWDPVAQFHRLTLEPLGSR